MSCCRWILACAAVGMLLAGCTEPERKPDARDQALKDPMNYNPAGSERPDITGGGILDLDRSAVRKDMDHVLSP